METYIYTLSDKTGIRYIGKSDVPLARLKDHLKEAKKKRSRKEIWIFSMLQRGELPTLEILDTVPIEQWEFFERYWISQMRAWNFNIVNGTDGGEGSNGFKGKKHSEETKSKLRALTKRQKHFGKAKGSKNGRSKLNEIQVADIKQKAVTISRAKLAKEYDVSKTTISWIVSGKRWK